jgi:hypothetical protein
MSGVRCSKQDALWISQGRTEFLMTLRIKHVFLMNAIFFSEPTA